MRKMFIASISIYIAVALFLILLLAFSISRGKISSGGGYGMKLVNSQTVNLSNINSIIVKYSSENITILPSDTGELIFKEYMNYEPEENDLSKIDINGNELYIYDSPNHFHFTVWPFVRTHTIEIYLPTEYSNHLSVNSSSGNISCIPKLSLSGLSVKSTSGNIKFGNVYADNIKADAASGNISFDLAEGNRDFTAKSGNINVIAGSGDSRFRTSSGNITIMNAAGYLDVLTSSGRIQVSASEGAGKLIATAGNINLELSTLIDDLNITASSGNVKLTIDGDNSFGFKANASSGDIRTYFDNELSYNKKGNSANGTHGTNPAYYISITTTSGNIKVNN